VVGYVKFDGEKPKEDIAKSSYAFLMAIVSSLLNTVDVIGSLIASGLNEPEEVQNNVGSFQR
jgi:hypothetical protein